jgi:hypothetical protein
MNKKDIILIPEIIIHRYESFWFRSLFNKTIINTRLLVLINIEKELEITLKIRMRNVIHDNIFESIIYNL